MTFFAFLKEPLWLLKNHFLQILAYFLPLLSIASIISISFGYPWYIFVILFIIQFVINVLYYRKVTAIYNMASKKSKILKAYSKIIKEIEAENFLSPYLKEIHKKIFINQKPASKYIKSLSNIFEWFDVRNSMIHFLINNIFCWDFHCVLKIEKWKKEIGEFVLNWFEIIGEFEALSSGAVIMYNNPDWIFPKILENQLSYSATDLGHPLIPKKLRICNDFDIDQYKKSIIIPGPNMAGKSTFLRTVGVNMVLGSDGFGVCAHSMSFSPVRLITSMKTSDSLDKQMSLFYAELLRLKQILDGIKGRHPVFYIIDEMLKGTNALDRQKGAIALLNQLLRTPAVGIVATHDLKLTTLEKDHPKTVRNFHFDGNIEDDKLIFDYKLKSGICRSFNALILMKKMGIEV